MIEIQVPDLGENVEEAEVLKVLVKEGDSVSVDQAILEFETEKATFEMPSSDAGTVSRIHVKEGDSVRIGQTVMELEATGSSNGAQSPERKKSTKAKTTKAAAKAAPGAAAKKSEPVDETAAEKPSATPVDGAQGAEKPPAEEPADEPVAAASRSARPADSTSVRRAEEAADATDGDEAPDEPAVRDAASHSHTWAAGPATRRLARELGVDLSELAATVGSARITREDLKAHVRGRSHSGSAPTRLPDFSRWGEVERQPMTRLERTAVSRLTLAWNTIPHVTQHDEADITLLEEARRRYTRGRAPGDPKITWTVLAVKSVVHALRAMPRFNASYDPDTQELILKKYFHIGIAVDTERGLLVPVLRDADRKSTGEIADEIAQLAKRARDKKLLVEDMEGGTFTISNLGGLGGTAFTPIVNHPEVAILGMSRARLVPDLEGGAPHRILPLSLSYDHRVIDGANSVRFLRRVIKMLEDPLHLLLES
jgi:pyruvate dehydrogenase E2 component (dihydrolipoamide acetyltransferase)